MYLTKVEIKNFRVYQGEHQLDLTPPTGDRNVYLIGGLNGAGKTSLFSAIVLGFYGQDAAGLVFERRAGDDLRRVYGRYLEESLSFGARAQGENEMSVALTFVHEGDEVRVHRYWWFADGRLEDESVTIYVNHQPLPIHIDDAEERQQVLQEYLEGVAPARVAKFFFFDGEEIRGIASRDPDEAVVDGLNQLLGFHALQRLTEDLQTLKASIRRELPKALELGIVEAAEDVDRTRSELEAAERELQSATSRLTQVTDDASSVEQRVNDFFGGRAVSRHEALDALTERERQLASMQSEIQSFVSDTLVLGMPDDLFDRTVKRAKRESQRRRAKEARARLRTSRDKVVSQALSSNTPIDPPLTRQQKAALRKQFKDAWTNVLEPQSGSSKDLFGQFTVEELERLPGILQEARSVAQQELRTKIARKNHLESQIRRLRSVQGLFDGGRADELLMEKAALLEARLQEEAVVQKLERDLQFRRQEFANKSAVLTRLEDQLTESEAIKAELATVERLQGATGAFMGELRRKRSTALAAAITDMMRRMVHKEELVSSVEISPEDFGIRIFDRKGDEVLNPSAGEREVFALSMVWGLARISNRSLPVIIDTPLGRLDQMHRANFVERFLPAAGEQVIVLSTDSEIDARWYEVVKPHVAQEILIDFSDEVQSSSLRRVSYDQLWSEEQIGRVP